MATLLSLVPAVPELADDITFRTPFSYDMTQVDARGMVLIDACVPAAMGLAFLKLLQDYIDML